MNNLVIMPVVIPVFSGVLLLIFRKKILLQRTVSLLSVVLIAVVSMVLIGQIYRGGIQTLQLGNWQAPFGISMVADMFSMLLVFTTSIVAVCCLWYAFRSIGKKRELFYFYPLFLFLIAGVNGSFLTGDIFNLFVCFEVMLIASYVLISLGGTKIQLRETIKYIVINMISSSLFLVAVAYLYRVLGTLNFAHLSVRVAEAGQPGILTAIAIMFLIVFSLKAGLFLFFWLPGSYSAPPAAVAAIFSALLTKVGMYSIIRLFTLVFYHEPEVTHFFIGILAALTMILGAVGAVSYSDIKQILTYNVIIGVGFILAGLASFTSAGMTGTLYYFIHDMIVKALIFLLGGTIIYIYGSSQLPKMSGLIRIYPYLGIMFFISVLSIAGLPPLSGFLGKIFITEGTFRAGYVWLGVVGLITSLAVLYSVMKIFMKAFWGYTEWTEEELNSPKGLLFPMGILTFASIFLGLGAEWINEYVDIALQTLMNPNIYIEAVLQRS